MRGKETVDPETQVGATGGSIAVALTRYPHTKQLVIGGVQTGLPLVFQDIEGKLIATFRKMARELAFGISEFGVSTALIARDLGMPVLLLPVFVTRRFDHEAIYVNEERIRRPEDLNGARIGLRSYTVTDAVWSRAAITETFATDLSSIEWIVTADEHIEGSRLPSRVEFRTGDLDAMIEQGEVDAILSHYGGTDTRIKHLFPDFVGAERDWYRSHRYVPIHHVIMLRRDVVEQYPDAPTELFSAFSAAKEPLLSDVQAGLAFPPGLDTRHAYGLYRVEDRYADDLVPYGIGPNRQALEDLLRFAKEQEIIADHWTTEEMFLHV